MMVDPTVSNDEEYNEKMQKCLSEMFILVGEKMMKEASDQGWKAPNQVAAEKAIVIGEIAGRLDRMHPWQSHEIQTIETVVQILHECASEHLHEAVEAMFPGTSKPS